MTAELRTVVRTSADIDLRPEELLSHLEHVLTRPRPANGACEHGACEHGACASEVTARCLYAVYDPLSARCILAGAGRPTVTVVRPDGVVTAVEVPAGPPRRCRGAAREREGGARAALAGCPHSTPDRERTRRSWLVPSL
ncbi:SpoIIE family protein phosphatase [Streptomyces spiralis]